MTIEMTASGAASSLTVAAAIVELAPSTVMHHCQRRKTHLQES